MGRITSGVGLVTGINIKDTVDQLIALQAQPRDLLVARNKQIQAEQVAVKDLTARLLSLEFSAKKLGEAAPFQQRIATSSNSAALAATITGDAAIGSHQFTPLAVAQAGQVLSSGFANDSTAIGAGKLSFRFGGFIDPNQGLELLGGGAGFVRGKIRITDRSGASAQIDLRFAKTIDDVLEAINEASGVNVTAAADGDRIRIVDQTGQTASNLKVQEVDQGTTAASLGLAGIDVAANEASGADVVRLFDGLSLSRLNGGNGVRFDPALADLQVTFRDGSPALSIDFDRLVTGQPRDTEQTIGDVLATLNAADPARLKAEIASGGDGIVLTDLTANTGGTFAVSALNGSQALADLGLATAAAGNTISGRRILAGLKTSLLSTLAGGAGVGTLGVLSLTDRSGATANVNLSAAQTLDDVTRTINAAGLGIKAGINQARNGIALQDTTGLTTSNLIVANGDANNSAAKLGIAVNAAQSSVNSGSLRLRVVGENTTLASLNGGAGVAKGSLTIFDSTGAGATLSITDSRKTVGDVLQAINQLGLQLQARINDAGDGIALVDTAAGANPIKVFEGGKTTAADLRLLQTATLVDVGGTPTYVLDGTTTSTVDITATDTLKDVIAKINGLKARVTASTLNDGAATNPLRLTLTSQRSGEAGDLLVDSSQAGFATQRSIRAQDARLLSGAADGPLPGVIAVSSTNTFADLLPGVSLTVNAATSSPVTVNVTGTDSNLVATVQAVVDTYNSLHAKIGDYTKFDEATNTAGPLLGDAGVLRVENELTTLLTGRLFGAGSVTSLESLGIAYNKDGSLSFDSDKFRARLTADPASVREFFTKKDVGFAAKIKNALEQLAGSQTSLLVNRELALDRKIELNKERIAFYNARLDRSREVLLKSFNDMELAIGKIKSNLSAINSITALPSLISSQSG